MQLFMLAVLEFRFVNHHIETNRKGD